MKNCVFCQIAKGKLPCWKIYEDRDFLAFLDINQLSEGHTLVIPKKHHRWVWDMPNIGRYFSVAKKIINHYQKITKKGLVGTVIWGEQVPHAHIQILPNAENLSLSWKSQGLTEIKAQKLVKKFALKRTIC